MQSAAEGVDEIRAAIAQLRSAANQDNDVRRRQSAEHLEQQFAGIADPQELREAARDALRLFGGGMGSFQDSGTSVMASALTRLREAIRQAI